MSRIVRTGVSFPEELLNSFDKVVKELGLGSRSKGIQEAIRTFVSVNAWRLSGDEVVAGAILIHYSHEERGVEEKLTEIQHHFLNVIPSSLHLHLTEEDCLLIIAVRGKASEIKRLSRELRTNIRLKQMTYLVMPIY